MTVEVYDLRTTASRPVAVYTCTPREAVICAFAQLDRKDWNTWDYAAKYGHLVQEGKLSVLCGDFCALKIPTPAGHPL